MDISGDIAKIARQEATLVFPSFDEATAFAIGSAIRERGLKEKMPIVVDIRTFDRPLFYAALPGSTADNANWQGASATSYRCSTRAPTGWCWNSSGRTAPSSQAAASTTPTMCWPAAAFR